MQLVRLSLFLSRVYVAAVALVEQARHQPISRVDCGHPYQTHGCLNNAQQLRHQALLTALVALNTGNRSLASVDRAAAPLMQQQAATEAMVLSVAVAAAVVGVRQAGEAVTAGPVSSS